MPTTGTMSMVTYLFRVMYFGKSDLVYWAESLQSCVTAVCLACAMMPLPVWMVQSLALSFVMI